MAMRCNKCKGIIPDIMINGGNFNGCECHIKREPNIRIQEGYAKCTLNEGGQND